MDSVIEVVANRLRIRGDDFHPCNSQFQSFQPFNRYAPFITGINPFQSFDVLKGYRVVLALQVVEAIQFNRHR
jgi:hypothetical protein